MIVREGLRGCLAPGVTPLAAAPLESTAHWTASTLDSRWTRARAAGGLLDGRDPEWLLGLVGGVPAQGRAPPVLHALFGHGVVLEPHLQNVLVGRGRRRAAGAGHLP